MQYKLTPNRPSLLLLTQVICTYAPAYGFSSMAYRAGTTSPFFLALSGRRSYLGLATPSKGCVCTTAVGEHTKWAKSLGASNWCWNPQGAPATGTGTTNMTMTSPYPSTTPTSSMSSIPECGQRVPSPPIVCSMMTQIEENVGDIFRSVSTALLSPIDTEAGRLVR